MNGQCQIQSIELVESSFKVYNELRIAEELLDVTLACDDYVVQAHKVILSASSSFFRKVIRNSNHDKPYIFLRGVMAEDLKSIVDFIYTGETQVAAENIQRFVDCGSELKVTGIMVQEETNIEDTHHSAKKTKKKKKQNKIDLTESSEDHHTEIKQQNLKVELDEEAMEEETSTFENNDNERLIEEINKRIMVSKEVDGKQIFTCSVCDKSFTQKNYLKFHIEIHLEGFSHACYECEKEYKTRKSLEVHKYQKHSKNSK